MVASNEVFRLTPQEYDIYERADLWKRLFAYMDTFDATLALEGSAADMIPAEFDTGFAFDEDASLRVYYPE